MKITPEPLIGRSQTKATQSTNRQNLWQQLLNSCRAKTNSRFLFHRYVWQTEIAPGSKDLKVPLTFADKGDAKAKETAPQNPKQAAKPEAKVHQPKLNASPAKPSKAIKKSKNSKRSKKHAKKASKVTFKDSL